MPDEAADILLAGDSVDDSTFVIHALKETVRTLGRYWLQFNQTMK